MPYILDISTAVPEHMITNEEVIEYYHQSLDPDERDLMEKKLSYMVEKTRILNRYSCISDFKGKDAELFTDPNTLPSVEKRMSVYKDKVMPLSVKAITKLLNQTGVKTKDITHLITVSCTGLYAPGLEFSVAGHFGLQHAEKTGLYFLGCYAAIKALKYANYIALSNPDACILIICVELSSLHFIPSIHDEDLVANLLFSDGASAAIVCGNESKYLKHRIVLNIDSTGFSCIPDTSDLMSWNITSNAFRMVLNRKIVRAIKENILSAVNEFKDNLTIDTDYFAIHPGGIRIVDAVRDSLGLNESQVADSFDILRLYGNMSSPTILFILNSILNKIKTGDHSDNKKIFVCAFGPGINIEMMMLSSVSTSNHSEYNIAQSNNAFQA